MSPIYRTHSFILGSYQEKVMLDFPASPVMAHVVALMALPQRSILHSFIHLNLPMSRVNDNEGG